MRGQKRVEDARKRAYDPRIHLLRKKFLQRWMDCRVKPGNDDFLAIRKPGRNSEVMNSSQPALQVRAHEIVVVEVRIGDADAVDLLSLSGSKRLLLIVAAD